MPYKEFWVDGIVSAQDESDVDEKAKTKLKNDTCAFFRRCSDYGIDERVVDSKDEAIAVDRPCGRVFHAVHINWYKGKEGNKAPDELIAKYTQWRSDLKQVREKIEKMKDGAFDPNENKKRFKCPNCDSKISKVHVKHKHVCPVCGAKFPWYNDLLEEEQKLLKHKKDFPLMWKTYCKAYVETTTYDPDSDESYMSDFPY